ncbi:MAG: hypothetical protein LBV70_03080 [Candidatus Adiutrix sp.]|jgi:hypothetical protein|nr:hypothetical protein [Candidatus Adiutrix sp.]
MISRRPDSGRLGGPAAFFLALAGLLALLPGCSHLGYGSDPGPEEIELPANPVERAAVLGLQTSYRGSTLWQIQRPIVINLTPAAPTAALLREQDPKELYCVCVEYETRYKVAWSTAEGSPWERRIRNLLVMKTQADAYQALKPLNVCPAQCE